MDAQLHPPGILLTPRESDHVKLTVRLYAQENPEEITPEVQASVDSESRLLTPEAALGVYAAYVGSSKLRDEQRLKLKRSMSELPTIAERKRYAGKSHTLLAMRSEAMKIIEASDQKTQKEAHYMQTSLEYCLGKLGVDVASLETNDR